MIVAGSPHPIKEPLIYSQTEFNEICEDLKISNRMHREIFLFNIEDAAYNFIQGISHNQNKPTYRKQQKPLEAFKESIESIRQMHKDLIEDSPIRSKLSLAAIKLQSPAPKYSSDIKQTFLELIRTGYTSDFLDVLEDVTNNAIDLPLLFGKKNKTDLVSNWILSIYDNWKIFSNVLISEGQNSEGRNQSSAMDVLDKMASPIDKILTKKGIPQRITNSMIAEAIKYCRQNGLIYNIDDEKALEEELTDYHRSGDS